LGDNRKKIRRGKEPPLLEGEVQYERKRRTVIVTRSRVNKQGEERERRKGKDGKNR